MLAIAGDWDCCQVRAAGMHNLKLRETASVLTPSTCAGFGISNGQPDRLVSGYDFNGRHFLPPGQSLLPVEL